MGNPFEQSRALGSDENIRKLEREHRAAPTMDSLKRYHTELVRAGREYEAHSAAEDFLHEQAQEGTLPYQGKPQRRNNWLMNVRSWNELPQDTRELLLLTEDYAVNFEPGANLENNPVLVSNVLTREQYKEIIEEIEQNAKDRYGVTDDDDDESVYSRADMKADDEIRRDKNYILDRMKHLFVWGDDESYYPGRCADLATIPVYPNARTLTIQIGTREKGSINDLPVLTQKQFPSLRAMSLDNVEVTEKSFHAITNSEIVPNLTQLSLHDCQFTYGRAPLLLAQLKLEHLTVLELSSVGLTDIDLEYIVNTVRLPELRYLNVSGNKLTRLNFLKLLDKSRFPNLRYINAPSLGLDKTQDKEFIDQFAQAGVRIV